MLIWKVLPNNRYHEINKLYCLDNSIWCRQDAIALRHNYFYNRAQFTETTKGISHSASITCGRQQGSILGPILLSIYM